MTINNPSTPTSCDSCDCEEITVLESYVAMTSGSNLVTVTFSAQPAEWAFDYAYVENTTDVSPLTGFCWTCTARSLTGFTLKFNAAPDSANYKLYYKLKTARRSL